MQQNPTEKDLQIAFHNMTLGRYELIMPNVHILQNEMDIVGIRKSGFVDEVEIKLSKSDFLADFKKTRGHRGSKHSALQRGDQICNYFAYLLPEELIDECKIPHYAGLYVFKYWNNETGFVREVKKPPRLHGRKISAEKKYEIAKKAVFRYWDALAK
jgi:hypothetical protein